MTITQLLIDTAVIAGVLLFAVLAVVPLWLEREAERADRPVRSTDPGHRGQTATVHRLAAARPTGGVAPTRPHAA